MLGCVDARRISNIAHSSKILKMEGLAMWRCCSGAITSHWLEEGPDPSIQKTKVKEKPFCWRGRGSVSCKGWGELGHAHIPAVLMLQGRRRRGVLISEDQEFPDLMCLAYRCSSMQGYLCVIQRDQVYKACKLLTVELCFILIVTLAFEDQ